jgi:Flp pilus assembly secretin CpaC
VVTVNAIARPFDDPLAPGKNPPALGSTDSLSTPAASHSALEVKNGTGWLATNALDAGSGPVGRTTASDAPAAPPSSPASIALGGGSLTQPGGVPESATPGQGQSAAESARRGQSEDAPGSSTQQPPSTSSITLAGDAPRAAQAGDRLVGEPLPSSPIVPLTPSQSAAQIPLEKFKSDPLATTSAPLALGPGGANSLPPDVVRLMKGTSRILDFPRRLRRVSVADTSVADVQVVSPNEINVIAHQEGFTTLAVWDHQGHYVERQIRVDPYGKEQVLLNCIVAELDRNRMETQAINWTGSLPNYNVSLVGLGPGGAATPYSSSSLLSNNPLVPTGTIPNGSQLIPGQLIPLLLSQSLNYGLAWGNSVAQTSAFFNFLETHNLAKVLAEPHLLANSGEKAEFLSGGEIPIVIAQALNTSIVFKQFGTSVIFVPTVVGTDDIELEVKPEVSEPDYAHGVTEFGFSIPAFVTRRAKTYVQMKNNQTLIIAGLLLHNKTSEVDKTPYLGDLPWIGNLFKHTSYTDQNTDLVMSVTPQIVQPLPTNGRIANPVQRGPLSEDEIRTERLAIPDASRPRF